MASISINSLIANQALGAASFPGPASVRSPAPSAEPGAVSIRHEPGRDRADASTPSSYTRKDVVGQKRDNLPSDNEPRPVPSAETEPPSPPTADDTKGQTAQNSVVNKPSGEPLTKSEMALLRELQKADQAVKAHEMAHLAAAGGYAKGGASFSYQRGPDGQNYAVGGEVQVDTGKEATPEATIQKMQIVRQAALAPIDPSPQDQRVAAHATLQLSEAFKELRLAQSDQASTVPRQASQDTTDTAQGIYQTVGQAVRGQATEGRANPKKMYEAYLKPLPTSVRSGHQGLDRTA